MSTSTSTPTPVPRPPSSNGHAPEPPPRPDVPGPIAAVVGNLFGTITVLRGARSLHPVGDAYAAEVRVAPAPDGERLGVPLLDAPGSHPAIVRLSRGAGLPEPLPDILGFALRLVDAHGAGAHQDFALASSAGLPIARNLLLPATSYFDRSFSSVLLYRVGGQVSMVGARPASPAPRDEGTGLAGVAAAAAAGSLRYELLLAAPLGRWFPVATVEVGDPLPRREAQRLRINPWNTGGGIEPAGPFMGLRDAAYRGSQRWRPRV